MKEYRKPELVRVELVADQAVLTNCKTVGGGSGMVPGSADCNSVGGGYCGSVGS
jgi:hypothetical protein